MNVKQDTTNLAPSEKFTRRDFLLATLAAGMAATFRPMTARAAIRTDGQGLIAGMVKIPVSDGLIPAYRAMPQKGTGLPVVLLAHDIFGMHGHTRDVCRRLAKLGYLAVAPALFARHGDIAKLTNVLERVEAVNAHVPDAQVMGDLDAAAAWAAKNGGHAAKLGITGFSWGGTVVWLYAAHGSNLKAGVAWYGRLTPGNGPLHPVQPLDIAKSLKAPVLGLYSSADEIVPVETVEMLQDELKAAKSLSEIVIYPDAPHGFFADHRPGYRPGPAQDGWKRMREWFGKHGVA